MKTQNPRLSIGYVLVLCPEHQAQQRHQLNSLRDMIAWETLEDRTFRWKE